MPTPSSLSSAPAGVRRPARSWPWTLVALAWMGAIFWASSQPSPIVSAEPLLDTLAKKGGHVGAFALLAVLDWLAVRGQLRGRVSPRAALALAFVIAVAYGAFDELHQAFTPTRQPSPLDVGIDAFGAAVGLWLASRLAPAVRSVS